MHPDYTLVDVDVPAILRTTPEVVADLVARGDIDVRIEDGVEYCSLRQLQNAGLVDLLTVPQMAASKGLEPETVESLIRLGYVNASTPFAPHDNEPRIPRRARVNISDAAIEQTEAEIKAYRKQLDAERKANAARAKAESERSATSKLAERLGIDEDLLADALAEVAN